MAKRKKWKVSHHDRGWQVTAQGGKRPTVVLEKKGEAIKRAKQIAQNNAPSAVVVHKADGSVQNEHTFD